MYSIQLPSGTFLELSPGTQLGFELQNSVFSSSDTSTLPGSFTFPLDLPASSANRVALGFPENVHTPGLPKPINGVWVRAHGMPMFYCTLTIRGANKHKIIISMVANPMATIKDKGLHELDYEGDRSIGASDAARKAHMQATLETPEAYDYVFAQLYNNAFFGAQAVEPNTWMNKWDSDNEEPELATETITPTEGDPYTYERPQPIMPFPKVGYVLRRIVETSADGWVLENAWQRTTEMKRLLLISLHSIWEPPTTGNTPVLPTTINLQQHVSKTKCNEFLKKLASTFQLGIFTNPFSKKISIIPLQEVMGRPYRHDWTQFAVEGSTVELDQSDAALLLCHKPIELNEDATTFDDFIQHDLSKYPGIDREITLPHYNNEPDFQAAISGLANGLYYIESTESVYEVFTLDGAQNARRLGRQRRCKDFGDSPSFETPLEIPLTYTYEASDGHLVPYLNREGSSIDEVDHTEHRWERNSAENPDAIVFYRGIQNQYTTGSGANIPYSSVHRYDPEGNWLSDHIAQITTSGSSEGDAQHSLLWGSSLYEISGIYDDFWQRWHTMLREGKPVAMQLTLPVAKLTEFSFEDKIRVGQMDYFVKSMRITKLYADGRFLVETKLFSII